MCIQDLFTDAEEMKNVYEVLNVLVGKCKLVEQLLVTGTSPPFFARTTAQHMNTQWLTT